MKKITLLFIFVLIAMNTISAQQSIGIKGGFNFSNLAVNKNQIDESKTKTGFTVGIINTNQMGLFYVQTELLYNRKGAEYSSNDFIVDANLDYLQIPISVGISLFGTPINVYGGAYAAYLLNADYEYKNNNDEVIASYDNKDAFKKLDLGVQAGLNFDLKKIVVDLRVSRGLTNVEGDDIITISQTFTKHDTKNFNLELTVGYRF